ncbi:AraC family transcriptional regulator [Maricaulis sp.]|uniref:AraC family transcriptional regulator n=1 Tax=Maricaulis sp. TaxID=1486257 RepID=UPI0025F895C9|nr:AraC family transcriptional regulator [Maricaulis sp.]MDF1770014.1 AraC family transcriptional regulator [Maricaulis sp.]
MMRRQTVLAKSAGMEARLTWYNPGEAMPVHGHRAHQLSWLLSGEMCETSRGTARELVRISRGIKPAGLPHANLYGPAGALVLALNIEPDAPLCTDLTLPGDWDWSAPSAQISHEIQRILVALHDGAISADLALSDLAGRALEGEGETTGRPAASADRWLNRVREQLRDDPDEPDMQQLAAQAGIHRVHLSRRFTRQYGLPPSLYRLRCKLGRAISGLMQGESAADAAQAGGFADQAHFTRAARRQTGMTPSHLRALLAA